MISKTKKLWVFFALFLVAWFTGIISPTAGIAAYIKYQNAITAFVPFVFFLGLGGIINWRLYKMSRRDGQIAAVIISLALTISVVRGIAFQWSTNQTLRFDYAGGGCMIDLQCRHYDGCGGGHGKCSSSLLNTPGQLSTCDINEDFPANNGYDCGCIEQMGLCGWEKSE